MSRLPIVPLNGLSADSLGAYLAALGLFSLAARQWPSVRAFWRNGYFCLAGGPATLEQIVESVSEIGERNTWTQYDRPWDKDKKADVAKKTSMRTARWRALEAEERSLTAFGAHLALDGRVRMNPLLGTGGNAGQRKFDRGWRKAVACIEKPPRRQSRESLKANLKAFLDGKACTYLGNFSAGSWFGAANKIYNHGTKQPFREGQVTPWAMTLACEGLIYFAGGASRQLGSRRQPKGAFPFVTTAMPPKVAEEAGGIEAEVWAPIWSQPMTEPELRSLYLRGRSELRGRGATSSVAFSVGILGRGVDAGLTEFRRFLLLHTTSAQTFESRLATIVPVPKTAEDGVTTRAVRTIVELRDALPPDRKVGQRWRFAGLRGPLDQALVDFSVAEPGAGRAEKAWAVADHVFDALAKVDRNRRFRGHNVRFRLLPGGWAAKLFRESPPDRETRLAMAMSSLAGTLTCPQFIAYRLGVEKETKGSRWQFPESAPARRVWSDAELTENLCAMGERRIMEALKQANSPPPFSAAVRVALDDVHAWLSGDLDERNLRLWLDRLCLFDWNGEANREAARRLQRNVSSNPPAVDGALAFYGLFRPLFSDRLFRQLLAESGTQRGGAVTCIHLARVIAMLRRRDLNAAVDAAQTAYRSAGVTLADFEVAPAGPDPDRLLAALVIPTCDKQALSVFRRWRTPTESKEQ